MLRQPPSPADLSTLFLLCIARAGRLLGRTGGPCRHHTQVGATVYALKGHAKYLAKELLVPNGKGTDASNCHDEEAEEEEFSDDEQARERNFRETSKNIYTFDAILVLFLCVQAVVYTPPRDGEKKLLARVLVLLPSILVLVPTRFFSSSYFGLCRRNTRSET